MISKISIIGKGNVGNWLYQALIQQKDHHFTVQHVSGRDLSTLNSNADIYIFALPDHIYLEVLDSLPFKLSFAVHTSGSLSKSILEPYASEFGVLYPFQTISCHSVDQYKELSIPICIDVNNKHLIDDLKQLATIFGDQIYHLDDHQRHTIHLAAVFASNFSNALYDISFKILEKKQIDWKIMHPLLLETVQKVLIQKPNQVQTGPTNRKDFNIINTHIEELKGTPYESVYKIMTDYILQNISKSS